MKFSYILIVAITATYLSSCGSHADSDHDHDSHAHEMEDHDEHDHDHEGNHGDEIILKPEVAQKMGVETAIINHGEFNDILAVHGQVLPSPTDAAVAVATTSGIVNFSSGISLGSTVNSGATIASVSARNISGGDPNESARLALEAAKKEFERATPLHADGIISTKEFNEIQRRYDEAKASYSPVAASGGVVSPISGAITSILVKQGEYVEAGQPVAQISKSTRLTLKADVPEKYFQLIPTITSANIKGGSSNETISLSELGGKITSGSGMTASQNGYIPVYFTFNNDGRVAPGSYVEVFLIGSPRNGIITVPEEALTEQQGEFYVYEKLDDEGYARQLVKIGGTDGSNREILSGLNGGEEIVVKGATVIRLAENSGAIPEGHSHNH